MKGYLSAATAATLLILPTVACAQSSGLASMHAQKRVGNKICMVDHYHNGSSSGERSRKAAEVAAIRSWESFTAWEYGPAWGSFKLADGKTMNCGPVAGSWSCDTAARPCQAAGPARRR
jgi:hypothetical protein